MTQQCVTHKFLEKDEELSEMTESYNNLKDRME